MNTISPLTSATSLGTTTPRSSGQPNWQRSYQTGDTFKATVLESEGQNTFLLDIGGESVSAQSTATLIPGQTLQLQMVSSSPQQIELKIVPSAQQPFFGRSLTLIGENVDLSDLLQNLHQTQPSPAGSQTKGTVLEENGPNSYIIDIAGTQVEAQSAATLTPGQTLQLQIEPAPPQIDLQIVPNAQQQTPGGSLTLTGDTVDLSATLAGLQQVTAASPENVATATVEQANGQGAYTLDIGGMKVEAQSSATLAPGQAMQVRVEAAPPQIALKIVSPVQQQVPEGFLTLNGADDVLETLFTSLQQTRSLPSIQGLSPESQNTLMNFQSVQQEVLSGTESGAALKHLVDRLGLGMENQVAKGDTDSASKTLKAALLEVTDVFKDSAGIADISHRLIGTLEVFQMAQQHLENSSNFITPLPLPFLKQGYLTVEDYGNMNEGSTSEKRYPLRFSLHLTVSDLGNLRIDCLQYQDGLYIRFNTDSKEKSDFVESFSDELKQAIKSTPVRGLSFSETAVNPTTELIQRLYPQGTSILDTKI